MTLSPGSESPANLRGGGRHNRHHHSHTGRNIVNIVLQLWVVCAVVNVVNAVAAYDGKGKKNCRDLNISV
ncbi:hypothetical protein BPAE_0129g00310 [Botrytis paeoniae]|uniref:Uncharacterized protein n=1 Tax=Botrytis paeoniae TaxID=278948 RepID=A0A4Z1FPC2_9HELO|nr:hypothetical protein BPAE_0129g00310 [Botrytis paeoniae]